MLKVKETIRLSPNVSHSLSEEVIHRYHLHEHPHGDDMLSARDVDMERSPTRTDGSTSHADWSISNVTWSRSAD